MPGSQGSLPLWFLSLLPLHPLSQPHPNLFPGDSHTAALTELGSVWAWGTFRDASGVFGFSACTRIQLTPAEVYSPRRAGDQVVRIVSGEWRRVEGGQCCPAYRPDPPAPLWVVCV